jgi:Flp pilus assembly protein TadG
MINRSPLRVPRGAAAVEMAIVAPVFFVLVFGLMIGAMGVFRYQQTAAVAREAARWASVHGGMYAKETGNNAATASDVYQNAIVPRLVDLDPSNVTYAVTWDTDNYPYHTTVDGSGNINKTGNNVKVSVSFAWTSLAYFGQITLTSTSVSPMSY